MSQTQSQFQKAMNALRAQKTNVFNTQYSTSGTGSLEPELSLLTYQGMTSANKRKTPNSIVEKAKRNRALQYGFSPIQSETTSPTKATENQGVFRPISATDPSFNAEGGKQKKRTRNRRQSRKKRKATRKT